MKITHKTAHTVSAGGQTYKGVEGVFDVPEEHALHLIEAHGFRTLEQDAAEVAADAEVKAAQPVRVVEGRRK